MTMLKTLALGSVAGLALFACSPASSDKTPASKAPAAVPAKPAAIKTQKPAAAAPAPKVEAAPAPKVEAAPAPAQAAASAVPPPSAKRLYLRRTCIACHGRNGARAIQQYPNLAGLNAKYIHAQVKDILSGKRLGSPDKLTGHPRTQSMRGALVTTDGQMRITDDEIKIIAAWLAGLPPAGPQMHDPALTAEQIAAGKSVFNKSNCRTCHGVDGNKPLGDYPRLAGQKAAYIAEQLRDIRDGARTNSRSRLMTPFVKKLTDTQINAVADYLSQVNPNP